MNCENLPALGRIRPPSTSCDRVSPINSFTVNLYGDIALLDTDGRVRLSTIRDDSDKCVQDVPVDKIDELLSCKFTNIEFNEDGTILLLWSSKVMIERVSFAYAYFFVLKLFDVARSSREIFLELLI